MVTNKTVFFMIGILLVVLGFSMLVPYTLQIIYNENSHSFVASSFVTIFIGILFILANLEKDFKLNFEANFSFSHFSMVNGGYIWKSCLFFYLQKNLLLVKPFLKACLELQQLEQRLLQI